MFLAFLSYPVLSPIQFCKMLVPLSIFEKKDLFRTVFNPSELGVAQETSGFKGSRSIVKSVAFKNEINTHARMHTHLESIIVSHQALLLPGQRLESSHRWVAMPGSKPSGGLSLDSLQFPTIHCCHTPSALIHSERDPVRRLARGVTQRVCVCVCEEHGMNVFG